MAGGVNKIAATTVKRAYNALPLAVIMISMKYRDLRDFSLLEKRGN